MKNGISDEKYYFLLDWKDKNMDDYIAMKYGERSLNSLTTHELNKLYQGIKAEEKYGKYMGNV